MSKFLVLLTAITAMCGSAAASPNVNEGRAPAPATPAALVRALMAAKDNSDESVLALLTDDSRSALMAEPHANALSDAEAGYQQALDQRFGPGTAMNRSVEMWPSRPGDVRAALKPVQSMHVLGISRDKSGGAVLRIKAVTQSQSGQTADVEGSLAVRREAGGWRIALPDASDRQSVDARTGIMQRITEKIRTGAYADRQAAMIAMASALAGESGR